MIEARGKVQAKVTKMAQKHTGQTTRDSRTYNCENPPPLPPNVYHLQVKVRETSKNVPGSGVYPLHPATFHRRDLISFKQQIGP